MKEQGLHIEEKYFCRLFMRLAHLVRKSLSKRYAIPLNIKRIEFLKIYLVTFLREIKLQLGFYDYLTFLASKYESDKGITIHPFHGYTIHYDKFFDSLRLKPINILEIGLARREHRNFLGTTCPSLKIWLDYFPNAKVFGLDIDDFSSVKMPRTKIICGDQGNIEDLEKVISICPEFDVIIDDGSHAAYHQQLTLKTLFPHISKGGLYIIEDLNWQPEKLEKSLPTVLRTRELLKYKVKYSKVIKDVKEIHFYKSQMRKNKESLAVIIKI